MDKDKLVIRYIDLASQYAFMICSNEPIDEEARVAIKLELYAIREQLGMDKITLR